ncbi:MAG TPA: hypothetical protein VFO42_08365 [Sphingomicrobium sp.]|nr:hypothetical protein [Sphingomicrobium sp.]
MRRLALLSLTLVPWLAAALGLLWRQRRGLPYNEAGRYFDERSSTVLHSQAVDLYGLIAVAALAIALAATWWAWRRSARP